MLLSIVVPVFREEKNIPVSSVSKGDRILVRNEEMIPADAILTSETGNINYSFVSGEHTPVMKKKGDLIYAGGRQMGPAIELEVVTPATGSHITQLWNNEVFKHRKNRQKSFIHPWSRYFTYVLFSIAIISAAYWQIHDSQRMWPVVTSILIVACPCSLLLSATFTYGNMVRIFGRNKMYLKNASVIETLGKINTIVFDKTGTITHNVSALVRYEGEPLDEQQRDQIRSLSKQSSHPLSKIITESLQQNKGSGSLQVSDFRETAGKGLEGKIHDTSLRLGSLAFVRYSDDRDENIPATGTQIHVSMNGRLTGHFTISNDYRPGIARMAAELHSDGYRTHLLSGDNDREKSNLTNIFGLQTPMLFRQDPQQKLAYIQQLQQEGKQVLMLGDGLNDAGALQQSDAGVAVSDNTNLFSPASDAILQGDRVGKLSRLLRFARAGKKIVTVSFIISILYNIIGMGFATQGLLSPLIAAILMPASSISIVIFVTVASTITARRMGLEA